MKDLNRIIGILALTLPDLKGIGPAFVKKAITHASFLSSDHLSEIKEITRANNKQFGDGQILQAIEKANEIYYKCKEEGISIVDFVSSDYPPSLLGIKDPPPILYFKGDGGLLFHKTVCIIGTRVPNGNGIVISNRIGSYFSNAGWAICNGLAEGVDTFSVTADDSFHIRVVGVLAGGLNYNSARTLLMKTARNAELALENGGIIVSENPPDKSEDTYSVIKSCRIQAGLSDGMILVQSSMTGGSRFTAKSFCEMQRPFGVIQPVLTDYNLQSFEANREIAEKGTRGIATFTGLKEEKILARPIFVIKSKEDYLNFENALTFRRQSYGKIDQKLFE